MNEAKLKVTIFRKNCLTIKILKSQLLIEGAEKIPSTFVTGCKFLCNSMDVKIIKLWLVNA